MKKRVSLLLSLSALLILVGAGCMSKQPEANDLDLKSDTVENSEAVDETATDGGRRDDRR